LDKADRPVSLKYASDSKGHALHHVWSDGNGDGNTKENDLTKSQVEQLGRDGFAVSFDLQLKDTYMNKRRILPQRMADGCRAMKQGLSGAALTRLRLPEQPD